MSRVDRTKYKTIVVSIDNYRWLKTQGGTSDSFNDVILRFRKEREEEKQEEQTGVGGSQATTQSSTPATPTPEAHRKTTNFIYKRRSSG